MKYFLVLLSLLTSLLLNTAISAAEKTGPLEPPFGIRHFNAGSAPNFTLSDIDGEKYELKDSRGHWVFLHFWASWCGPCQEEMPAIQILADTIGENDFQIIMINTAEDEDTVFEFLAAIGVELNSLLDSDGIVTEVWKPRGLPTSFLIDPDGNIRYQAIGGREWNSPVYLKFIRQLIASD